MAKSETTFYNLAELSEIASKAAKAINSVSERLEAIERHIGIAKEEPKLDRWYKRAGRSLVYLTGITRGVGYGYGFDIDGNWFDRCNGNPIFIDCLVEATPQEVEEALVREAKRRGYKSGVTAIFGSARDQRTITSDSIITWESWNDTMALSMGCDVIFRQDTGKWAEIIEVDKFAELKEAHKNGAVIQVKYPSGNDWHDCDYPRWVLENEYRIKPEEKPKVGDVCKFWDDGENKYVVSVLTKIKEGDNYPYHTNFDPFKYAKPLTKEEAINLLFGNQ